MRTALAALLTSVALAFGAFVGSAQAGEYYGGYYSNRAANVRYSSDCCYRKVVRVVRTVRYVRVAPVRRYGYECCGPRPWREGYYGRPASYTEVYVPPRPRYVDYRPRPVRYIDLPPASVNYIEVPPPPPRWQGGYEYYR